MLYIIHFAMTDEPTLKFQVGISLNTNVFSTPNSRIPLLCEHGSQNKSFITSVPHPSSNSSPFKALWSGAWTFYFSFCILVFSDRRVNPGSSLSPKPLPVLPDLFVVYLHKDWPTAPSQDPGDRYTNGPFRLIYRAYSGPGTQGDRRFWRLWSPEQHLEKATSWEKTALLPTSIRCYWNYNNNNSINNERYLCRESCIMTAQKQNITLKKQNGYFVHSFLQHPLFSPLFKKKNKAKPHKRLHGEVRFKKTKN